MAGEVMEHKDLRDQTPFLPLTKAQIYVNHEICYVGSFF